MGLDMYLEKHTYVKNWDHMADSERHTITIAGPQAHHIKPERIQTIVEQVAYWRKANAIHAWFIKNCAEGVDNCQAVYVPTEKLQELLSVVNSVLAGADPAVVLPAQAGFFFGSTDYDEWYMEDMKLTKQQLEAVLAEKGDGWGWDYYYRASW